MAFVAYGKQTIATAGTPQQLVVPAITANVNAQAYVQSIIIQAAAGNTNNVYVGDSTLVKSTGVGTAAVLPANGTITLPAQGGVLHPLNIWFDTDTNSNVVYASAVTK